jgi:hypothetical protein
MNTNNKNENNGNILIRGSDLTPEQRAQLKWNGAKSPQWVYEHSFWFKNGKPSTDDGYYYPVFRSLA